MEKTDGRPIQALLVGLPKLVEMKDGDSVFFGRRTPPTVDELEARMQAIREEIAAEKAMLR